MAGEASARGESARELGRQARDRINADFNVDNLDTSEPKSHRRRDTAAGHARPFDTRGAEPALGGASAH
jgi:hypothetical protein